jgi:hypothetical protein
MMKTEPPGWFYDLRADSRLEELGVKFFSDEKLTGGDAADKGKGWEGKRQIGSGPAFEDGVHKPDYWLDPADTTKLLIDLSRGDENSGFLYPISPDYDAIKHFYDAYCAPGLSIDAIFPMVPKGFAYLRGMQESPDPLDPEKVFEGVETHRQIRYFLGVTDEDGIVGLENAAVFNRYLNGAALTLATASESDGDFSQYWTAYSKSLLTFEFNKKYMGDSGQSMCILEFDYAAQNHSEFVKSMQAESGDASVKVLPDDVPLDVLGTVMAMGFEQVITADDLLGIVNNEGSPKADRMNYLLTLSALTGDSQFEEVFKPFLGNEDEDFVNFTATEALDRDNRSMMEASLASSKIYDDLREALKEALEN